LSGAHILGGDDRKGVRVKSALKVPCLAIVLTAACVAGPLAAEVVTVHPSGFVVRHEVVVEADTKATWLALINPATWWNKDHTWSGDSANLSLAPSAGGCFCERIPEVEEPDRLTLEGTVEHMRVIQSYPEAALRMRGGLGPLQSEPVTGILTIAISKTDKGTRLVWEYNVAGYMRYEIPVIARAVDAVIGSQSLALAKLLGPVSKPAAAKPIEPAAEPAQKAAPVPEKAAPDAKSRPKVNEAFGDLISD
jgi:hypothetical protein